MSAQFEEPPLTGDEAVDAALRRVAGLVGVPPAEHPPVLREAQEALQGLLNQGGRAA
ncbi:MAG: hypothetical protein LBI33_10560 [Propionibacteriaceae bacterium]|jgi:hypothetical protein|nr:hypothetical protein [Propionibacteriaceae bacterium]